MAKLSETLADRKPRYGRFDHHAARARAFINVAEASANWNKLPPDTQHATCYILDKLARALEGDPDYSDNWHDIAGYATLIEDRLNGTGSYAADLPNKLEDAHSTGCSQGRR